MEDGHLQLLTMLKLMDLLQNLNIHTQLPQELVKRMVEASKFQAMHQLQVALDFKIQFKADQFQSLLMLLTGVLIDQEFSEIVLPQSTMLSFW